jgi:predicted MFS family arabinose efflux permease
VTVKRRRELSADFWRLWTASSVSSVGDGVRAAALVDRWDRKRTLWGVDLGRAAVMSSLAAAVATHRAGIPMLLVAAFLLGTGQTLADSAAQAALPAVVPPTGLEAANGRMYAGMVIGGAFAGPPLGSAMFAVAAAVPFGFDAASFLIAALLAVSVRADLAVRDAAAPVRGMRRQIGEGLRWLWSHRELRAMCILLTVWNLVENAVFAVLVLWALEVLRLPAPLYGVLLAGLASGGVAGSLLAGRLAGVLGAGGAIATSLWVTATAYAGLAFTSNGAVAFALLALIGGAAMVWNVLSASFRQTVVPSRLQGRVNSIYRGASWGVISVGAALGGLLADRLGLRAPFLLAAAVVVVAGALGLPWLRTARLAAARAMATDP